jgi:hypothetical protein
LQVARSAGPGKNGWREAETDRRIETTLDAQMRDGLLEEIAELDRRGSAIDRRPRP